MCQDQDARPARHAVGDDIGEANGLSGPGRSNEQNAYRAVRESLANVRNCLLLIRTQDDRGGHRDHPRAIHSLRFDHAARHAAADWPSRNAAKPGARVIEAMRGCGLSRFCGSVSSIGFPKR